MLMTLLCQYFHQRLFLENNVWNDLAKLIVIMFECWPGWTHLDQDNSPGPQFLWRYLPILTPPHTTSHLPYLLLVVCGVHSVFCQQSLPITWAPDWNVFHKLCLSGLVRPLQTEVNKRIMLLKYFTRLMMMLSVSSYLWRQKPKPGTTGRVKQLTRKS